MRKNLSRCFSLALTVALFGLMQVGCKSTEEATTQPEMAQVSPGALALCTSCGQFQGTAVCCQADQALCAACGLAKGSPGCCRIEKDSVTRVALCTGCGQFKGSAECCASGQVLCTKCKLVKGSPGCCKIKSGTR